MKVTFKMPQILVNWISNTIRFFSYDGETFSSANNDYMILWEGESIFVNDAPPRIDFHTYQKINYGRTY